MVVECACRAVKLFVEVCRTWHQISATQTWFDNLIHTSLGTQVRAAQPTYNMFAYSNKVALWLPSYHRHHQYVENTECLQAAPRQFQTLLPTPLCIYRSDIKDRFPRTSKSLPPRHCLLQVETPSPIFDHLSHNWLRKFFVSRPFRESSKC